MNHAAAVFSHARSSVRMLLSGKKRLAAALVLGLCSTASADDVLFENVRIFDGKGAVLSAPSHVLVKGTVLAVAEAKGVKRWHLSMSHDGGIATATVLAEG